MGTAFLAASFSNIMNYLQTLFSFFNVPLFLRLVIGLFWRRTHAARRAYLGVCPAGPGPAMVPFYFVLYRQGIVIHPLRQGANFVSALAAFASARW
ncbi:hypothetical protein GCM10020221_21770 [Streptomyces thioluteus]|uniref:Uncharacterized protein n=1 Tax=Streptomyces thioluteus TaxID=66431 RepID=A0ABP6J8L1_STRTU